MSKRQRTANSGYTERVCRLCHQMRPVQDALFERGVCECDDCEIGQYRIMPSPGNIETGLARS